MKKAIKLFLSIVWRKDSSGGRMNISTAWEVSKLIHLNQFP
jgi:hypothetical protein